VSVAVETKACRTCGRDKPTDGFRPGRRVCRECSVLAGKAAYLANSDRRKAASRAYHAANLEACRERSRLWSLANKDLTFERGRKRRLLSHDDIMEKQRLRRAANIEATREQSRRSEAVRRARMAEVLTIPFTKAQLDARLAYYGHKCWMCRGPYEHLDHVKPICKGGPHILANLRPACASCNRRKGGR